MEWHRLRVFYHVAKAQSITRAAMEMNIAQPAVTRNIQQLEYQAKAPLFIRHPRGLTLTKQGEILFHHVKNIVAELEQAKNEMSGLSDEIAGKLVITANYAYASTVLFPYICEFLELYPQANINFFCSDKDLDLTKNEADVAIRMYDPLAAEVEQIHLNERSLHLYAHESYLKKMGNPKTSADLDNHKLIIFDVPYKDVFNTQRNNWLLTLGMKSGELRESFLIVNSVECLVLAAMRGLGIIALSEDSLLLKQNELIPVLPDLAANPVSMCYVYPKTLKNLKIVNVLGNFLKEKFTKNT